MRPAAWWSTWTLAAAVVLALGGCREPRPSTQPADWFNLAPPPPAGVELAQCLQAGDRLLFVGDEITEDGHFVRAVATALLPLMSDAGLRFYNGGMTGATAAMFLQPVPARRAPAAATQATTAPAPTRLDELVVMTHPTVIFICLGLNDGQGKPLAEAPVEEYRRNLDALVQRTGAYPKVRSVVVVGPPALPVPSGPHDEFSYNRTLEALAQAAREVAHERRARFIDLFAWMKAVYADAARLQVQVSFSGRGEAVGIIMASRALHGLGVTGPQLAKVGWSPVAPAKMSSIRGLLAIRYAPPDLELAQRSKDLYEGLIDNQVLFYRAWRVAGSHPSAPAREQVLAQAEEAWARVEGLAQAAAGGR